MAAWYSSQRNRMEGRRRKRFFFRWRVAPRGGGAKLRLLIYRRVASRRKFCRRCWRRRKMLLRRTMTNNERWPTPGNNSAKHARIRLFCPCSTCVCLCVCILLQGRLTPKLTGTATPTPLSSTHAPPILFFDLQWLSLAAVADRGFVRGGGGVTLETHRELRGSWLTGECYAFVN